MNEIIFSIVMLFQVSNGNVFSTATGFFYESNGQLFLVTNRHVVNYSTKDSSAKLIVKIHTSKTDLSKFKTIEIPLVNNGKVSWFGYSNPEIDVIAIPLGNIDLTNTIINPLSNKNFPPKGLELEVGSELLVIGYPRGFTDKINQLPIAKNCIVSTPIQIPFDGKPYFLMDGNLFPGMSGAPVITKASSSHNIKGGISFSSTSQFFFMGIHSATFYKDIGIKENPIYILENGEIKIKGFKKETVKENLSLQTCWYNGIIEDLIKQISK
jgi:hypothetical protein